MDENTVELIAQLCTRIGMIMEDASVVALTIGNIDGDGMQQVVADLQRAADNISRLVAAVKALQ